MSISSMEGLDALPFTATAATTLLPFTAPPTLNPPPTPPFTQRALPTRAPQRATRPPAGARDPSPGFGLALAVILPSPAVVDATAIVSPIPMQDLGGNQFPVHGCWSDGPGADFKALAAAQHPEALSDPAGWAVLVGDEADEPSDTVDLADVALRLAMGELTLAEPWLLVWKSVEGVEGAEGPTPDAQVNDDGGGDGEDADGRRVRAKLAV